MTTITLTQALSAQADRLQATNQIGSDMTATATIIIYAKVHRAACLAGLGDADEAVYDEAFPAYVDRLTAAAGRAGFALQVNAHDMRSASYSVDAPDPADEQAAHDFMQAPSAGFWESL